MVEAELEMALFPQEFFSAESFVAPEFASLIDRYYQRFYKRVTEQTLVRMFQKPDAPVQE